MSYSTAYCFKQSAKFPELTFSHVTSGHSAVFIRNGHDDPYFAPSNDVISIGVKNGVSVYRNGDGVEIEWNPGDRKTIAEKIAIVIQNVEDGFNPFYGEAILASEAEFGFKLFDNRADKEIVGQKGTSK